MIVSLIYCFGLLTRSQDGRIHVYFVHYHRGSPMLTFCSVMRHVGDGREWSIGPTNWHLKDEKPRGSEHVQGGESLLHSNLIAQRRKMRGGLYREWTHQGDQSMGQGSRVIERRLQGFTSPKLAVPWSYDEMKFTQSTISGSLDNCGVI